MAFFPKNIDFFELFDAQAEQLKAAAVLLREVEHVKDLNEHARRVREVEHAADQITHKIFQTLNQTFITPIDREDIIALASRLDDVIDMIDVTVSHLALYHVSPQTREIEQYLNLLDSIIEEVGKAVPELKRGSKGQQTIIKQSEIINFIENQVDQHNRRTIGELVNNSQDPITVIKLKEVYEDLEAIADRCEDVANILETIVVKNQ
ncbi:DUF47 domain-containing protein [Candidatus Berkelbacteria bacterium]|nr:DUF47 domain-containing protein [Candidatus Berkelbacteria bacterium]